MIESIETPMGRILLAVTDEGALAALGFYEQWPARFAELSARFGPPGETTRRSEIGARIERYLAGDIEAIDAIRTDAIGTPFQRAVWDLLRRIPAGETASYSEIASRLGRPTASRAVGAANGQNPVAIVVPCHRVIGKGGALTGYAGGIDRKRWLLAHEARYVTSSSTPRASSPRPPRQGTLPLNALP